MAIQQLFLVLVCPVILSEAVNYCKIQTCAPRSHTLCIYNTSRPAPACGTVIRSNLTFSEKMSIVKLHNDLRRQVFTGQEERGLVGPQPAAAKVTLLKWDDELELMAQRWSEQCRNEMDQCRNVGRFLVNQNVGGEKTLGIMEELTLEEIIQKWYDEVIKFNYNDVHSFREVKAVTVGAHHYSQMVWASTTRIGCASMRHFDGRFNRLKLVCNYGPRGNNDGQRVYKVKDQAKPVSKFFNWCTGYVVDEV